MYVLLRLWTIGNSACAASANGIRADLDQAASFMHVVRYRPEADAGLVSTTSNSGDDSELADELDVIDQTPVSVYSQQVDDLAPGDTLEALSEVQVETNDHRAAVHSTFVLADGPDDVTGTPLQADNFTEVSPYMASLPIHDSTGVDGARRRQRHQVPEPGDVGGAPADPGHRARRRDRDRSRRGPAGRPAPSPGGQRSAGRVDHRRAQRADGRPDP